MAIEDALDEVAKNLKFAPVSVALEATDVSELTFDKNSGKLEPLLENTDDIILTKGEANTYLDISTMFAAGYLSDGQGHYARMPIATIEKRKPSVFQRLRKNHPWAFKALVVAATVATVGLAGCLGGSTTKNGKNPNPVDNTHYFTAQEISHDFVNDSDGCPVGVNSYKIGDTVYIKDTIADIGPGSGGNLRYDASKDKTGIRFGYANSNIYWVHGDHSNLNVKEGDMIILSMPIIKQNYNCTYYAKSDVNYDEPLSKFVDGDLPDFEDVQGKNTVRKA